MRADRLLSILMYLQTEGRLTAGELARRLEVSERTIYRDMDALGTAGVPVFAVSGVDGGFSLPPHYRTKLDGLTKPEVHALFLHMSDRSFHQLGIGDSLRTALLKLLNALPGASRQDVDWIKNRVYLDTDAWRPSVMKDDCLQEMQQAIWEEKRVVFTYLARNRESSMLTFEPYSLVAKAGIWFVVGAVEQQTRAYRLARIQSLTVTDEPFHRPDHFVLQTFWQEWMAEWEAKRSRFAVVLAVDAEGLARLTQMNVRIADAPEPDCPETGERVRVTVLFEQRAEAVGCVFALGSHGEVVEPPDLRRLLREQAAQIVQRYES